MLFLYIMKKIKNFILSLGLISIFYENVNDSKLINLNKNFDEDKKTIEEIILERAEESRTIMFGDFHHPDYLETETLLKKLMPDFKDLGFDYLCIEIPTSTQNLINKVIKGSLDSISYINKLGSITEGSGKITNDGAYNIIKEAAKNNFKIIAYDDWSFKDDIEDNKRDKEQFENLKKLIFMQDINAKAIIFCGNVHVSESRYLFYDQEFIRLGKHLNDYTKDKNLSLSIGGEVHDPDISINNNKIKIYR